MGELKSKMAGVVREQNGRRRESEKAASFLRESGATYLRGVFHKRAGWWSAHNVFLAPRSIEARAVQFERLNRIGDKMLVPDSQFCHHFGLRTPF